MALSSLASASVEDVAEASGRGLCWLQLYFFRDASLTQQLVRRAEMSGYKALVITVDSTEVGKKLSDLRNGFYLPEDISAPNLPSHLQRPPSGINEARNHINSIVDPSATWANVDWLRGLTDLPIVMKGILTAEDAEEACRHNVQGIIVSNHGGRQLDGAPATVRRVPPHTHSHSTPYALTDTTLHPTYSLTLPYNNYNYYDNNYTHLLTLPHTLHSVYTPYILTHTSL